MNKSFAAQIGAVLGRLLGILVRKGVLTVEEKSYILEGFDDEGL